MRNSSDRNDQDQAVEILRELGLILIGYSLASQSSRGLVFGLVSPEEFPLEIAKILSSIKDNSGTEFLEWLSKRGITVDGGEKAIMRIGKRVRENTRRVMRKMLYETIRGGSVMLNDKEFVEYIQKELDAFIKTMD